MKKRILFVGALVIIIAGCQMGAITPENPLGIVDPNQALVWFEAGRQAGIGTQAVGVAVGNPAIIGIGILIAGLSTVLGASVIKK